MDETTARFIERTRNKYWGKYRGLVSDNNDPRQLGRLKVRVPSLLGDVDTGWAWPVVPFAGADVGFFFMPQVGDEVWVEFEEGDLNHPLWTGCSWARPGGQSEVPAEAQQSYPDKRVLKTPSGHLIIIDDSAGQESITIRARDDDLCQIVFDAASKKITVQASEVVIQGNQAMPPEELATKSFVDQVFKNHTHPSGVGPTGTPVPIPIPHPVTTVLKAE